MGATKESWIKRKANGNGTAWNKGLKGVQVSWNKGNKIKEKYPKMGFQKGHPKFTSLEGIRRAAEKQSGANHHNWKGGITPLVVRIRGCYKVRQWRNDVFTRDDFTCQNCLVRGGKLVAHHIEAFFNIMKKNNIKTYEEAIDCEELWNTNNGLTLCNKCHRLTPNYGYKVNNKVQYVA